MFTVLMFLTPLMLTNDVWKLNDIRTPYRKMLNENKTKPQATRNKTDKQKETNHGQIVTKSRGCRYFLPKRQPVYFLLKRLRIDRRFLSSTVTFAESSFGLSRKFMFWFWFWFFQLLVFSNIHQNNFKWCAG